MYPITGYEGESEAPDVPEQATTVDAVQVPNLQGWTLDPDKIVWIVIGVLALGFGVWFVGSYSKAKTLALAAATAEASNG